MSTLVFVSKTVNEYVNVSSVTICVSGSMCVSVSSITMCVSVSSVTTCVSVSIVIICVYQCE